MADWQIVLRPIGQPDFVGSGWLEILKGEKDDAREALEDWAETINRLGYVPDSGDWRNMAGCTITTRAGKMSFRVRCDSFERETEHGVTNGAGYLRAVEIR